MKSIKQIFTVEMKSPLRNVKFSPDARFFSTLHNDDGSTLVIWDFDAVKSEGDAAEVPHVSLAHGGAVVSYKFRGKQLSLWLLNILQRLREPKHHSCKRQRAS